MLGVAGALLLALPGEAARLQSWQFDAQQNQLTFATDVPVQPRAQLIFNPTRLVIDLPGTSLGRSNVEQQVGGGIQAIRVGQFDRQTTRIVIELAPGYTMDPQQVQVRGETDRRWSVQLPQPEPADQPDLLSGQPASAEKNQVSNQPVNQAATRIQGIVATTDGFFIRTRGATPVVQVSRNNGQNRQISLEFADSAIALGLTAQSLPINRYSVSRWEVTQTSVEPPTVRITMTLTADSPDWQLSTSPLGGIVILPSGTPIREIPDTGGAVGQIASAPSRRITLPGGGPSAPAGSPATIQPQLPQGDFVVVIDPGHGGRDPGAVGIGGLQEKQVIFPISQEVAAILRQQGVEVVLTRDADTTLDLAPRVQIAQRANADLFISIHANAISMSRPEVNGLETYYYSGQSSRFARTVHDIVLRAMGMRDRNVRQARFYVIRNTSMPAILIETGFVTGAADAPNLRDPAWRSRMAEAIAQGILTYLQQNF
jgi:N-acetylmuramoyl-L-alanine amidase